MTQTIEATGADAEPALAKSGGLRRICIMYPDRVTGRQREWEYTLIWNDYQVVGAELGLEVIFTTPENVAVEALRLDRPRFYVDTTEVTPADTLFVTELYSMPWMMADVFNQVALYAVLEKAGFYLPLPPHVAYMTNDKLATLLYLSDSPIPPVPTTRICTGREVESKRYEQVWAGLEYPVIVKPVSWGGGWGIQLARDIEDLRAAASLAAGSETALVAQPYLAGTSDYRVFIVDGQIRAAMRRKPKKGHYVANGGRGGKRAFVPVPPELELVVPYLVEKFPMPYFCVDFLYDGEKFWLSEVEPDGCIAATDRDSAQALKEARDLIAARFQAYRKAHERWLAGVVAG